jgi:hypothetical protein
MRVTADVRLPYIIAKDDQNIGLLRLGSGILDKEPNH